MAKSGVSLTAPRPLGQRSTNEYIEAPLPRVHQPHPNTHHPHNPNNDHHILTFPPGGSPPFRRDDERGQKKELTRTTQPLSSSAPPLDESIICPRCCKCRCASCSGPREPPSAWLCSDLCYVSPDSCVDYLTCLCCVKGVMYHCSRDEEWPREPCSCSSSSWLTRWACLGLTSLVLPCLCCYCPLKALSDSCTSAYAACSHRGCVCSPP